jgi:NADH-quinone oxidoreductase subunit F
MSSANLIEQSDFIVMLGTRITLDNVAINESVNCAIKNQGAEFIYMHPIDDVLLEEKYTQFIKYEVGSEEAVVAMLAFYLLEGVTLDNIIKEYLEELDMGYLSGESSVGEEECEDIVQKLVNKKSKTLIIGSDLYTHERATNIAKLLGLIHKYTDFKIIMIPNNSTSQEFETTMLNSNGILEEIAEIDSYNGTVIYQVESNMETLQGSQTFAGAAKIKNEDQIKINYGEVSVLKTFRIDNELKGTVALYPSDNGKSADTLPLGYRYKQVKIEKVEI